MRSFAIFLGLIALGLAGIAFLAYPVWLMLPADAGFKFHRVASRVAMLTFLVGFILVARRLKVADRVSLGFALPAREFLRAAAKGWLLGVILMAPVVATMVLLDMRAWKPSASLDALSLVKLMVLGIVSGLAVALIEEVFMRGVMHSAIARESGTAAAVVLVSLIYAASHFFSRVRIPADQVHSGSGIDMLTGVLAQPVPILDAFLCLAAVGVLLGMVRALTGNIAACVGLHAGWVAVILVVRGSSVRNPEGPATWMLSDYDGFIGWMVLAWIIVIGFALYRWYGGARRGVPAEAHRPAH
jgi:membrane protease YdiL (CAAX protease family)